MQSSSSSQKTSEKKRRHKKEDRYEESDNDEYTPAQSKNKRSRHSSTKKSELDDISQSSSDAANDDNDKLAKKDKLPSIVYHDHMGILPEMADLQRRYSMLEPLRRALDSDDEESDHASADNHREASVNDDEESAENDDENNENNFSKLVDFGTKLKLLANVYLGKFEEKANIFVPQYVLDLKQDDGSIKRTPPKFIKIKGKICVFASGGTYNAWEKTVAKVYEILFAEKVKIVRVAWVYKHLLKKSGESAKRFYENLRGNERTLHSEYYYDLVFRNFILPKLMKKHPNKIKKLTVNAFSWWEVCDGCHTRFLQKHQKLCVQNGIKLAVNVVAREPYEHTYSGPGLVSTSLTQPSQDQQRSQDQQAWRDIWQRLKVYVGKYPLDNAEKENFWTNSPEGLELCKWIGQAFVENKRKLAEQSDSQRQGEILAFYEEIEEADRKNLDQLIDYLREKNWELSCWFFPSHFADTIQSKWKTHSKQIVIPHFDWEHLRTIQDATGQCQMCGYDGLRKIFQVYHPKHGTSKKIAVFQAEEAKMKVTHKVADNTPFNKLPKSQQEKMKRSLFVGSECLKFMKADKREIDEWRVKNPEQRAQEKLASADAQRRESIEFELSEAMPLLRWMTKFSIEHGNSPVKRSDITAYARRHIGDLYEGAKELTARIDALIHAGKIEIQNNQSTPGSHVYIIK